MARGKEERESRSIAQRSGEGDGGQMMSPLDWIFDQMERSLFGRPLSGSLMGQRGRTGETAQDLVRIPQLEIEQRGDELVLNVEVPGLERNDIQIEMEEDALVIRGERQEQRDEKGTVTRSRRSFYREIALPPGVDAEQAQATLNNGVLSIRLPKPQERGREARRIPISGGESGGGDTSKRAAA